MFFYGTLRHLPLLELVLGHDGAGLTILPAQLPGYAVSWASGESYPLIHLAPGGAARGLLVQGVTAQDRARLDFYEGGHGYVLSPVTVETAQGLMPAEVYLPPEGGPAPGAPWHLEDWQAKWAELTLMAAAHVMGQFGHRSAEEVARRYPSIRAQAAARLNARQSAPTTLRRETRPGDIEILRHRNPYAHFFSVEEFDLRHRRFDRAMSAEVERAVFIATDAVTVLPYDPVRDVVLLIEQFRLGPLGRGDAQCWSLEAIAGRIDPGETPEQALRREAMEEAGITLGPVHACTKYYASPGAVSEYIYSYIGLADLPDSAAGLGGLLTEDEDIRAHVVPFERLMQLFDSGELENAPLVVSVLWLALNRARLRAGA